MPIRVALVEDLTQHRDEIAALLKAHHELELAGVFSDAESALQKLPALKPQVILMDIRLPGISGVECVNRIKALLPDTEIMMLTVFDDYEMIFQSLRAGATGYLLKKSIRAELVDSIRELEQGGSPMSASIARKVVQAFGRFAPRPSSDSGLSTREEEILGALAQGKLYKEIADEFHLSYHTVRAHLRRIYKKLQVNSRHQAVQASRH